MLNADTAYKIIIYYYRILKIMLYTKSIQVKPSLEDGLRVSVMSSHTLNDGIAPDPIILLHRYDVHMKALAPPDKLVDDYYKRNLSFKEFTRQYMDYLQNPNPHLQTKLLAELALTKDVTILCVEENADFSHRRLLAEECKRICPNLEINIDVSTTYNHSNF